MYFVIIIDKNSNLAAGAVVSGDVVNADAGGELTPSNDGDSVTHDAAVDTAVHGKVFKQDVITITGRRENCEAARDAMLVCKNNLLCSLYFSTSWVSQYQT